MNCPRCTQGIPADASYCPHCGLDLSTVQREPAVPADLPPLPDEPILDGGADAEPDVATDPGSVWPRPLRLHRTRSGKRPFLAATLAFFFGPFAYLYLEQANWFWWGFLGGIFLLFVSRGEVLPRPVGDCPRRPGRPARHVSQLERMTPQVLGRS